MAATPVTYSGEFDGLFHLVWLSPFATAGFYRLAREDWEEHLEESLENDSFLAKSSLPPVVHTVLLEPSHSHPLLYCLWLLSHVSILVDWVFVTVIVRPAKPTIFIIWLFAENIYWLYFWKAVSIHLFIFWNDFCCLRKVFAQLVKISKDDCIVSLYSSSY